MSDDVTITVRVNNQTAAGFRDVNGHLRDLQGRFASAGGSMQRSSSGISKALVDVRATMLSLAPAAVPVAASLAPIAMQAGAAGVAVAAFGAAVIPQISNMKNAAEAQKRYTDATAKYGAGSKQAVQAGILAAQSLSAMPAATQRAAAGYAVLQDRFKGWSNSLAGFTMAPITRSFAVLGAILPKLSPMVKATSTQLSRLITVAGGAINTPGFNALAGKFSGFATKTLKGATDGVIHFMRSLSQGNARGPLSQFMQYAREQGPAVRALLVNIAKAVGNLLQGAAQAGPGMLSLVNAFAKLVAAVPPELIGRLMQVYAAFKLIKLAGVGIGAAAGGIQSLGTKIAALQAASVAAGGGMAGLRAGFMALGTAAKATVIVAGIAAVVLVLTKLSSIGKKAPPDINKMTTSLGKLGQTGKLTGEGLRVFGKDLGGLSDALRGLSRPSNLDKTQQFLTSLVGMDSTPVKKWKEDLDGADKALANLVKGGHADLAANAFDIMAKGMEKSGLSSKELKGKLDDYRSALADQAFENKLAAQSMGLFGDQAQAVQAKLDAQKQSADGLRQSIQALNDVNRSALGGMIGFEAAIDAATDAAKKNAGALTMSHGQLDLNSQKSRDAASALNDLAAKTDEAAAEARQNGQAWSTVAGIYDRGRAALIRNAEAMGLTKRQAQQLANQILKTPNKTALLKGDLKDLAAKLADAKARLAKAPSSKTTKIKGEIADLQRKIAAAKAAIAGVHGKSVSINIVTTRTDHGVMAHEGGKYAKGGVVRRMADGGAIDGGSGTQDDVPLLAMGGEFIVNKRQSKKYRSLLEAVNEDRVPHFAKGGLTASEKSARSSLRGQFGISTFGREAGYSRTPFERSLGAPSDVNSLVTSLNQARGEIKAGTRGGTESRLVHQLDSVGRKLIGQEKALSRVNDALGKARDKLASLKDAASQLSSSIKSSIVGSGGVVNAAQGSAGFSGVGGILSGMRGSTAQAQQFAAMLASLKKRGLNAQSISEIAGAGIEGGGYDTAQRLMGASGGDIKQINTLERQLTAAAGAAGKTTADAMYAGQIKAQDHLVSKLGKQQARLEKAMASLAKTMEKAISRAIGRKAAGGIIGAASGGSRGGMTWVGEQGPELADMPAGSRVYSSPDSRRMVAASRGGGGGVMQVNVVLDGKVVARALVDPLRGEVQRISGGNVQKALGR